MLWIVSDAYSKSLRGGSYIVKGLKGQTLIEIGFAARRQEDTKRCYNGSFCERPGRFAGAIEGYGLDGRALMSSGVTRSCF